MKYPFVEVQHIEKYYATVKAVDKVSFKIHEGEIFALLGPNGAGKTTMVRMLLHIMKPDSGTVHYYHENGQKPKPADVGYLPEERGLYQDIPVIKTLTYFGTIRGMDRKQAREKAMSWLERLDLKDRMNEKIQALSKGNQQKIQFIASILHEPKFAVLDEPFSGFDPINQELISGIIRDLCNNGTTVLLSAHQMQLVERIADRLLLMNKGREVLSGTLDKIRNTSGAENKITIRLEGQPDLSRLREHPSVENIESLNHSKHIIYVHAGGGYSELLKFLGTHYDVQSIQTEQLSLHDIYVKAIGN